MQGKELITIVISVVLVGLIYFLPGLIASRRNHNNMISIFLLNLFLGWTFLGWVTALIWSFSANIYEPKISKNESGLIEGGIDLSHKICPFCAEEIKVEAVVCKHCRSDLTT